MPPDQLPPLAQWNPTRDCWETTQTGSLFSEHLDVYSETWPNSGSMRNGIAYERLTLEPPTAAPATSSLLPTPSASLGVNGGSQPPDKRLAGGHSVQLHDVIDHL